MGATLLRWRRIPARVLAASGAILLTGVLVMGLYRVRTAALRSAVRSPRGRRGAVALIVAFVLLVAVPLAGSTARIVDERLTNASVEDVATAWADEGDWEVLSVTSRQGSVIVRALGAPPSPEPEALRSALDEAGLADVDVRLQLVPEERIDLDGGSRAGSALAGGHRDHYDSRVDPAAR